MYEKREIPLRIVGCEVEAGGENFKETTFMLEKKDYLTIEETIKSLQKQISQRLK